MIVKYNISRLDYVLSLFGMTRGELLNKINEGHKNILSEKDVFTPNIDLSLLRRIDKVFKKGVNFYLDPVNIEKSNGASIFFRKQVFAEKPNFGAREVINRYEDLKFSLSAISDMSNVRIVRRLKMFSLKDDPKEVVSIVRPLLYPAFSSRLRDFLKSLIGRLAEYNVLVFEFIETWNKKDRANIDGLFLNPNIIVLKRTEHYRREIFTLAHELGHYLINSEEIDSLDDDKIFLDKSKIEKWCNDFAFFFLVGDLSSNLDTLTKACETNDYHHTEVECISNKTNLSKLAIFTRLLSLGKISRMDYTKVRDDILESIQRFEDDKKEKYKESDSKGGSAPRPILSPLFISTLQNAFYSGVINEYEFCNTLKISAKELDRYLL